VDPVPVLYGVESVDQQIAHELDFNKDDVHQRTCQLRAGIVKKKPSVTLSADVECEEISLIAGHKGHPEAVQKKGEKDDGTVSTGHVDEGPWRERSHDLRHDATRWRCRHDDAGQGPTSHHCSIHQSYNHMGACIFTDEYDIYARLQEWGYTHKTVCHSTGEYARDDDGDGFHEVHVNTIEGFWSLLRSWIRPHRGYRRRTCPSISASLNSSTMQRSEGRLCLDLYWSCSSLNSLESILSLD